MTGPNRLATGRQRRHALRQAQRRRRRGGQRRGPVVLQRAARRVADGLGALRRGLARLVSGNRPLVAVLLGAMVLAVLMLSGPAQRYLDSQARVDSLSATVDALEHENARLERRAEDLDDPLSIELLAREQQGFIRPGEVPYTLVPPEVERPRIAEPREVSDPEPDSWFERGWVWLRTLGGVLE